ncbi:hypothetical protein BJ165DRAFT_1450542 [Panaeolus papilionaceus]|nr:hypothetical protein BJ165DRAFT_1450542 [Panaeolus papilionaceus]
MFLALVTTFFRFVLKAIEGLFTGPIYNPDSGVKWRVTLKLNKVSLFISWSVGQQFVSNDVYPIQPPQAPPTHLRHEVFQ